MLKSRVALYLFFFSKKKNPKIILNKIIMVYLWVVAETKKMKTGLPDF